MPRAIVSPIRTEDKHRYPPDWPQISRQIRQQRALNRCECTGQCGYDHDGRCPSINGGPNPVTGSVVVLTVAHLDRMPENCDPANLLAMCQRCHLAYDKGQHKATAARNRAAAATTGMEPLPERNT